MQDLGDKLLVIVNNDTQANDREDSKCCQACEKKGQPFMPARERVKLVRSLACVDAAIESIDKAWKSACSWANCGFDSGESRSGMYTILH